MKIVAVLCLLCASGFAWAGTYTAATCDYSDVKAIINGPKHKAVNGDVIVIPAGTCTWTTGITISGIGITIEGQGTPKTGASTVGAGTSTTILVQNMTSSLFSASGVPYGQLMRYSMMYLKPEIGLTNEAVAIRTSGTCTQRGCPNIRVDNVTFDTGYTKDPAAADTISNNLFGVYDHNTFYGSGGLGPAAVQISFSAWQGVGDYGDESFAAPDSTGTAQALFLENNDLEGARGSENDVGFNGLGGDRYVIRYNISNATPGTGLFSTHGTAWTGRDRGTRQREVYRNQINCSPTGGSCGGGGFNSGMGYVFENAFAAPGSGWFNHYLTVDEPRAWRAISMWGFCAGAGAYDLNDGTIYASGTITAGGSNSITDAGQTWSTNQWAGVAIANGTPYSVYDLTRSIGFEIASNTSNSLTATYPFFGTKMAIGDSYRILRSTLCLDQPGRAKGTYLSGTSGPNGGPSPKGWSNQVLEPIYEFADTRSGHVGSPVGGFTKRIQANRDYYAEVSTSAQTSANSPFNGTTGTGFGILANRPSTCVTGVGYWATDQGNWNKSGGEQGELYICTAKDTWTMRYEPFTYPHPLTVSGSE